MLDTCGDAGEPEFRLVAAKCDLVYYDLKLIDAEAHCRYTGAGNAPILANLAAWQKLTCPRLLRVELLPYNRAAGGKYAALGMAFQPGFDESAAVNASPGPFTGAGVEARIAGAAPG